MLTKGMHEKVFLHKFLWQKPDATALFRGKMSNQTKLEGFIMRPSKSPLQAMALYSAILSQLVGSVLIGVFTGMWLDDRLGTAPFFMIICLFIGITAGVWAMLQTVRKFESGDK